MPEGTRCSAQTTAPLPPTSKRVPPMSPVRQSVRVGHVAFRLAIDQESSSAPAIAKRAPAIRSGGSVSTANRMARYVEPQTMYTAANAAFRRTRIAKT